jgi:glycerate-2-kinase
MIKNYNQLATTDLRKKILNIINTGLKTLDVKKVINNQISLRGNLLTIKSDIGKIYNYDLSNFSRVLVVGIGKGCAEAAGQIEKILGSKISQGVVIDIKKKPLKFIEGFKGTHPIPSVRNLEATKKIINMIKKVGPNDLVIVLVFGGGSALFCSPAKISLSDLKKYTKQLMVSGKDIYQINTVRKHLSLVKGGKLAQLAYPATVVSCIFSDIPGNDPSFIASGPTVKDRTTIEDAQVIGKEFGWPKNIFVPAPKEDKYFKKVRNILVFSNRSPLLAMEKQAERAGFDAKVYSYRISGEAKKIGKKFLKILRAKKNSPLILAGGESTVHVKGKGKGGRNQELVLGTLPFLRDNEIVLAVASDGWDNTEAAGAIADTQTKLKAEKLNLNPKEFFENNDSFHFFKKTNDLVMTERGINVADFIIVARIS